MVWRVWCLYEVIVVWCDMMWCDVMQCGMMVWCVWCLCEVLVVWCDVMWCAWCGVTVMWYDGVVWRGVVGWGGVWCGVTWCDVMQCGMMVWCVWCLCQVLVVWCGNSRSGRLAARQRPCAKSVCECVIAVCVTVCEYVIAVCDCVCR